MKGIEIGYLSPSAVVLVVVEEIVPIDGLELKTIVDCIFNQFVPLLKLLHNIVLLQFQQIVDGEIDLTIVGWGNHLVVTTFAYTFESWHESVGETTVVDDAEQGVAGFNVRYIAACMPQYR